MLTAYRRHIASCPHRSKGQRYTLCNCPLWVYGARRDGTPIRESLRTKDWTRGVRRVDLLDSGTIEHFPSDRGAVTLHAAVVAFTADASARKLRDSTLELYGYVFGHLEAFCGDMVLAGIDTPTLDRFRQSRQRILKDGATRPIEASTQRKEIGLLRAFFSWCQDRQWVTVNPARRVRLPAVGGPATLPFTDDEVSRLIAACDRITSDDPAENKYIRHRARALVFALLYSGLRISDVAQLRRSALDPVSHHLTLRVMKTGVRLKVLLHADAATDLESLPSTNPEYFFWSGHCALNTLRKNLARTIDRLGKLAGIKARPHRFRDTFAVELLTQGADIRTVQLLLGHESVKTTEKWYSHFVAAHQSLLDSATAKLNFGRKPVRPVLVKPLKNRRRNP